MLALEDLVLALLGDGFAELYGAVRKNIWNYQHDGIVGLVIQRDGHRLGLVVGTRQLGLDRKYQRGCTMFPYVSGRSITRERTITAIPGSSPCHWTR